MKMIGTYLATALLLLGLVAAASAQGPGGPGGRMGGGGRGGGRNFDPAAREWKILDQLNLSPAQKKKAKVVTDDYAAKLKAEFGKMQAQGGGGRPDFSAMRAKMKPLRDHYHNVLAHVLNPGQMAKYDKIREEMRSRRGGPGGPGGGGGRGA